MNEPVHVVSVLHLSERHLAQLRSVSPRLVVQQHSIPSEEQWLRASDQQFAEVLSPETEILYTHTAPFDVRLTPKLRWVQVDSAGVNLLHNTPLWKSDIPITSANGVHTVQIAEHVLAMLLAHAHHLPLAYRLQERAQWASGQHLEAFVSPEIRGKTLGVVGYGAIGRQVARLAAACGMHVLATKRRGHPATFDGWSPVGIGDPDGSIPERFYDLDELHTLLAECDAIVLALPLSKQTQCIIGKAELSAMRPHAFLINIGRGALIDQNELIAALQEQRLGGAALDVTDPEPLPADSPLWTMKNVIVTPDLQGDAVARVADEIRAGGGEAIALSLNILHADDRQRMIETALSTFHRLDALVNNAGVQRIALPLDVSEEHWDIVMNVNAKATYFCCQLALKHMIGQRSGRIVNMASIAGKMASTTYHPIYNASKAAVLAITKTLAQYSARYGVRVNAVCPGMIETPMQDEVDREVARITGQTPAEIRTERNARIPLLVVCGLGKARTWLSAEGSRQPGSLDERKNTCFLAEQGNSLVDKVPLQRCAEVLSQVNMAFDQQIESIKGSIFPNTAVGYIGDGADAAAIVSFLVGPDSRYMTGQALNADGGILTY